MGCPLSIPSFHKKASKEALKQGLNQCQKDLIKVEAMLIDKAEEILPLQIAVHFAERPKELSVTISELSNQAQKLDEEESFDRFDVHKNLTACTNALAMIRQTGNRCGAIATIKLKHASIDYERTFEVYCDILEQCLRLSAQVLKYDSLLSAKAYGNTVKEYAITSNRIISEMGGHDSLIKASEDIEINEGSIQKNISRLKRLDDDLVSDEAKQKFARLLEFDVKTLLARPVDTSRDTKIHHGSADFGADLPSVDFDTDTKVQQSVQKMKMALA